MDEFRVIDKQKHVWITQDVKITMTSYKPIDPYAVIVPDSPVSYSLEPLEELNEEGEYKSAQISKYFDTQKIQDCNTNVEGSPTQIVTQKEIFAHSTPYLKRKRTMHASNADDEDPYDSPPNIKRKHIEFKNQKK